VNNNDPTARAIYRFALCRNLLPLHWCLFTNVIPWWDGTRAISREQRQLSSMAILTLLDLLPALQAIVLVGRTAQLAWLRAAVQPPPGVRLWCSDHPSLQVRAACPERWAAIRDSWLDRSVLVTAPVSE
jgi:hypothetical protein